MTPIALAAGLCTELEEISNLRRFFLTPAQALSRQQVMRIELLWIERTKAMGSARTGSSTKVEDMSDFRQYLGSMLNI
jgi:hypothetical protein